MRSFATFVHDVRLRTRRRGAAALLALAAAVGVAACGNDPVQPETRPAADLNILRRSASAPPLVSNTASFWAVKGQDRELRMVYAQTGQSGSGAEFLRLRVNRVTLLSRPDGSLITDGDSVLITVTADPVLMSVDFQPSGLRFSTTEPAELRIRWAEADDDINHDGKVDGTDAALKDKLAIWRHESANDPWDKLATILKLDVEEAEAKLTGFSGYAVAY
jgi:hypothetical protein